VSASWLLATSASTARDQLPVVDARHTCTSVTSGKGLDHAPHPAGEALAFIFFDISSCVGALF
jgi:hypothetical protein